MRVLVNTGTKQIDDGTVRGFFPVTTVTGRGRCWVVICFDSLVLCGCPRISRPTPRRLPTLSPPSAAMFSRVPLSRARLLFPLKKYIGATGMRLAAVVIYWYY